MKRVLVFLAGLLALCAAGYASTITYNVSANSTFLYQTFNDSCANSGVAVPGCQAGNFAPTIIPVNPGDTVILTEGGGACYSGVSHGVPQGCVNEPLGGVFDSSDTDLLSSSHMNRFQTSINAGLPNVTDSNFNTYYSANGYFTGVGVNTQIPNDFYICGPGTIPDCSTTSTTVVVPTGAYFLYVAALDSFYADNSSNPNGGLTVTVTNIPNHHEDPPPSVPEPGTWAMMVTGLALTGFAGLRRRALR